MYLFNPCTNCQHCWTDSVAPCSSRPKSCEFNGWWFPTDNVTCKPCCAWLAWHKVIIILGFAPWFRPSLTQMLENHMLDHPHQRLRRQARTFAVAPLKASKHKRTGSSFKLETARKTIRKTSWIPSDVCFGKPGWPNQIQLGHRSELSKCFVQQGGCAFCSRDFTNGSRLQLIQLLP